MTVVWDGWHLPLFFLVESFQDLGPALAGWFIGLLAGSVVLTWMYRQARHSILLVALWHTTYNFTSGTTAADGLPAALTSTAVIVLASAIVAQQLHRRAS